MLGKMAVKLRPHQSDLHIRADQHSLRDRGGCRLSPELSRKQWDQRQYGGVADKLPAGQVASHKRGETRCFISQISIAVKYFCNRLQCPKYRARSKHCCSYLLLRSYIITK